MGRILGKVEDGMGGVQYFIHCDTADSSFAPLFGNSDEAWGIYDANDVDGLHAAVPAQSRSVRVVLKSLSFGRTFSEAGETNGDPQLGIATEDRLIVPVSRYDENYSLMQLDGVFHLARLIDGGFMGQYHVPRCNEGRNYDDSDEVMSLSEFFGKPIAICPHCFAAVTKHKK